MPLSTRTRAGGRTGPLPAASLGHFCPSTFFPPPTHTHWAEQDWGVKQMGDLSTSSRTLSLLHGLSQEQGLSDRHTQELALSLSRDVYLLSGRWGHMVMTVGIRKKAGQFQAPQEKHGHSQTLTSLQRGPASAVPRGSPYLPPVNLTLPIWRCSPSLREWPSPGPDTLKFVRHEWAETWTYQFCACSGPGHNCPALTDSDRNGVRETCFQQLEF